MLQLQGNGWVSLPSEECYTLQCLLKTQRHKLDCGCGGMHQGSRCLAFLFGLQQDSQHALRTTAVLIIWIWEDLGGVLLACVCSGSCCLWAVRHSLGAHPLGAARSSLPCHIRKDLVAHSQLSVLTGGEGFRTAGAPRGLRQACSPACRSSPVPSPFRTQPGSTPVFSGSVKENSSLGCLGVVFNSSL